MAVNGPKALYVVTVCTGNVFGAGTDARVFIKLIGTDGPGPEIELSKPVGESLFPFSTNANDEFKLYGYKSVGTLVNVHVRHDNSGTGIGNAWYLDKIKVLDVAAQAEYEFTCDGWLSKNKTKDRRSWSACCRAAM